MKSRITVLAFSIFLFAFTGNGQSYDVYVSDAGNYGPPNHILKYSQNGENGEIFIDEQLDWPQDIVFLEDRSEVLISNLNTNKITRYNADDGSYLGDFATGINGPTRMAIGEDGLLYVLMWRNTSPVLRYDLDGNLVDEFTNTGVSKSIGMDWDAEGNFYVSSYDSFIQKFSPEGEDLGRFVESHINGPTNIWFDADGNLKVLNWNNGLVQSFASDGAFIGTFITGVPKGEGVAILPNGDLLIGSGDNDAVQHYQSDGTFIGNFAEGTEALPLLLPNAVVLRETAPTSTPSVMREADFVAPTLGRAFRLADSGYADRLEQVTVYDTTGKEVHRNEAPADTLWNASAAAPGVYVLVARFEDGRMLRQKVVVPQ